MTPEEKFMFDLEGYLVIKNVLSREEIQELNEVVDRVFPRDYDDAEADTQGSGAKGVRSGPHISSWDVACQNLIDHPKTFPYLVEFLGPKFRLDHDYSIFMTKGGSRGGLHGGQPDRFHHYYRYRDGVMQCGLSVLTYMLSDAGPSNFRNNVPRDVKRRERIPHYVVQPEVKAGDALFFTEALVHGTMTWKADHERRALLYKYGPGHMMASPKGYNLDEYTNLTERQKRILSPASVHNRADVKAKI